MPAIEVERRVPVVGVLDDDLRDGVAHSELPALELGAPEPHQVLLEAAVLGLPAPAPPAPSRGTTRAPRSRRAPRGWRRSGRHRWSWSGAARSAESIRIVLRSMSPPAVAGRDRSGRGVTNRHRPPPRFPGREGRAFRTELEARPSRPGKQDVFSGGGPDAAAGGAIGRRVTGRSPGVSVPRSRPERPVRRRPPRGSEGTGGSLARGGGGGEMRQGCAGGEAVPSTRGDRAESEPEQPDPRHAGDARNPMEPVAADANPSGKEELGNDPGSGLVGGYGQLLSGEVVRQEGRWWELHPKSFFRKFLATTSCTFRPSRRQRLSSATRAPIRTIWRRLTHASDVFAGLAFAPRARDPCHPRTRRPAGVVEADRLQPLSRDLRGPDASREAL